MLLDESRVIAEADLDQGPGVRIWPARGPFRAAHDFPAFAAYRKPDSRHTFEGYLRGSLYELLCGSGGACAEKQEH
ncbi:hypothetical protein BVG81_001535 [Haliangium sp. UPWRP_2]|nr:hypothetical protein BVG81_001535 [Haliangium sp. UPWRP_2]